MVFIFFKFKEKEVFLSGIFDKIIDLFFENLSFLVFEKFDIILI